MPTLHVLRHAKSDRGVAMPDHERPLASRGRDAAPRVGRHLGFTHGTPHLALSSTAARAVQTVELVSAELPEPLEARYEALLYLADPETLRRRLADVDDAVPSVLLVGHNPGLAGLVAGLAGAAVRARIGKLPTAALATLEVPAWPRLAWETARLVDYVTPKELT